MTDDIAACWHPRAEHYTRSGVARLQRHLGLPDYDALPRLALEEPGRCWRGVAEFCEFLWNTPPVAQLGELRARLGRPVRRDHERGRIYFLEK